MIFVVALGAVGFGTLLILLMARYSPNAAVERAAERDEAAARAGTLHPRIAFNDLRMLVIDLLEVLGFRVALEHAGANDLDIIARSSEPLRSGKYMVQVAVMPPGDVVDQAAVLRLQETVKAEGAAKGILFTPYAIDRQGLSLDVELELYDGRQLRELIARYLPKRLDAIEGYRGF